VQVSPSRELQERGHDFDVSKLERRVLRNKIYKDIGSTRIFLYPPWRHREVILFSQERVPPSPSYLLVSVLTIESKTCFWPIMTTVLQMSEKHQGPKSLKEENSTKPRANMLLKLKFIWSQFTSKTWAELLSPTLALMQDTFCCPLWTRWPLVWIWP
jgi:hypothetical protein